MTVQSACTVHFVINIALHTNVCPEVHADPLRRCADNKICVKQAFVSMWTQKAKKAEFIAVH